MKNKLSNIYTIFVFLATVMSLLITYKKYVIEKDYDYFYSESEENILIEEK